MLFSEWVYFYLNYGKNLISDLYKEKEKKYLIDKNVNNIGNIDVIFDSIQKSIDTNKQFNQQEIILNNEIKNIIVLLIIQIVIYYGIDTNLNIEKTKNNKKNEMFLKQVSNSHLLYLFALFNSICNISYIC